MNRSRRANYEYMIGISTLNDEIKQIETNKADEHSTINAVLLLRCLPILQVDGQALGYDDATVLTHELDEVSQKSMLHEGDQSITKSDSLF